jgi:hypothetical protein
MSLSKRVGLQWEDGDLQEHTNTYVVTSLEKHFVDIRLHKPGSSHELPFEWAFCGVAHPVEQGSRPNLSIVTYTHDIDSRYIAARVANQENPEQYLSPDTGRFKPADENGIERETGQMLNPTSGRIENYVELWQHMDPLSGEPINPHRGSDEFEITVLATVPGQGFKGKIVRVGNFIQGILSLVPMAEAKKLSQVLSLVRAMRNSQSETFEINLVWGEHTNKFPINFGAHTGEVVSHNGVKWVVLEESNHGAL